jgi:IMP dehydrogenase
MNKRAQFYKVVQISLVGDMGLREKDTFFNKLNSEGLALTYDDVRLRTGHSETEPARVDLSSQFSRNISLQMPIVSSPMDTVTEAPMAIAMATLGGLGIIHKNLTPQAQAGEVTRVKHYLHALIPKPICVSYTDTIESVLNKREEKGWSFHSFPVLNNNRLVGIVTRNDFEFATDITAPIHTIMSTDLIRATPGTLIADAYNLMVERKKKLLPLVDENGTLHGLYVFSDVKRIVSGDSRSYNLDERGQLCVGAAIGVYDDAFSRVEKLRAQHVDVFVIDTAHGDSKAVIETLQRLKQEYSNIEVMVGNVSEGSSARRLIDAGADGIKVGQGPGSICTTRIVAGIGCPQVSAVYNCALAARGTGVPICADGGLKQSGDIPIALAAGAHSVMMGSMLAGTTEAPGEIIYADGRSWKGYRGMGSIGAMETNRSSRERYRQEEGRKLVPEGIEGRVAYKGDLAAVLHQYTGGLRAGMGYVGAATIEELRENGEFIRITNAGLAESHPHDIVITREAPNYQGKR